MNFLFFKVTFEARLRVTISTKIFIIYKIQIVRFNMNPKTTFFTINEVFFITNGLLHGKVITIREKSLTYVGLLTKN